MKYCGIDIDGILNFYPQCWLDFINMETCSTFVSLSKAKQNISKEHYTKLKDLYRQSSHKANLIPRTEAIVLLKELKKQGYGIIILTTRPFEQYPKLEPMTRRWLDKNDVPYDLLLKKEPEQLRNHHLSFCIDDDIEDAKIMLEFSNKVFLYNNENIETNNDNIIKIKKLDDIKKHLFIDETKEILKHFKDTSMLQFWIDYVTGANAPHYHIPYKNHLLTKLPCDMFIYPHILNLEKPDVVVEIGTQKGGSAIFFSDIISKWGGKVITIDISTKGLNKEILREFSDKNIDFIHGDITQKKTTRKIRKICNGKKCLVVDDGSHKQKDVYTAFRNLNGLISEDGFYIIEDGMTNAVLGKQEHHPNIAIGEILRDFSGFGLCPKYDRYVFSTVYKGILQRKQGDDMYQ